MTLRRSLPSVPILALAALAACGVPSLAACHGNDTPRDSHVVLTHESRRALVTGVAGGPRPTLDLAPGCGGFVNDGPPDQVIEVRQPMKLDFVARSVRGPVALVVVGDDGALCDGDGGTGHAPRIHTVAQGRYRVWVASMHANEHLPYELSVAPASKDEGPAVAGGGGPAVGGTISVSIMSTPAGAEVRSPTGQVMGQTPAMFEVPAPATPTATLAFVVDAPGHQAATVSGVPVHGELVLNAVLGAAAGGGGGGGGGTPTVGMEGAQTQVAAVSQRIRDYTTATQTIAWPNSCIVANLTVETVIHHTCLSDLRVRLASPNGTTVTLHDHAYRNSLSRTWTTTDARGALARFVGQEAQGTWTMTVRDDVDADSGTFQSFTMHVVCQGGSTLSTTVPAMGGTVGTLGLGGNFGPTPTAPRVGGGGPRGEVIDPWH